MKLLFDSKMGGPGFEPGTNRLKAEYSTVELATLLLFCFSNFINIPSTAMVLSRGF
jgi:hypothetical protein